jgi:hypothetical protein
MFPIRIEGSEAIASAIFTAFCAQFVAETAEHLRQTNGIAKEFDEKSEQHAIVVSSASIGGVERTVWKPAEILVSLQLRLKSSIDGERTR